MSGNRVSPGSDGPNSAFRKLRLIWSAMSMTVPEPKLRRIPPAAFVRTRVLDAEPREDPHGQRGERRRVTLVHVETPALHQHAPARRACPRPARRCGRSPWARESAGSRCRARAPRRSAARRTAPAPSPARSRRSASARQDAPGAPPRPRRPSRPSAAVPLAVTAGCPRSWRRGSWRACRRAWRGGPAGRGRASAPGPARRCRRAGCRPS